MATNITIKASGVCSGGGHAQIDLTGDVTYSFRTHFEAIGEAAQALTDEDMIAAIIRIALRTRTGGQVRTALLSVPGLTVTV